MNHQRRHIPRDPEPPLTDIALAEKLHEEASLFRKEALQTLHECKSTLETTQRFNDQANLNQHRLALAVSSLLPKTLRSDFNLNEFDIDNTAEVARRNVEAIEQRDVFDIVHAINVLAMANTDALHIFSDFSGHVSMLHVRAHSIKEGANLLNEMVWLRDEYTEHEELISKLLSIESRLTELVIEAREEAEANKEV